MTIKFELSSATLFNGTQIEFTPDSITVIVGPNNAGKSCFLREIYQIINNGHNEPRKFRKVIDKISLRKDGNEQEYKEFLRNSTKEITSHQNTLLKALNVEATEANALSWWNNLEDY